MQTSEDEMALLLCDGFDSLAISGDIGTLIGTKWTTVGGAPGIAVGRRPDSLAVGGLTLGLTKVINPGIDDFFLGFAFFWSGNRYNDFLYGSTLITGILVSNWAIAISDVGEIEYRQATFHAPGPMWWVDDLVWSVPTQLVPGAWNYFEIKREAGVVSMQVNNVAVAGGSAGGTGAGGNGNAVLNAITLTGGGPAYDDFYMCSIDAETPDFFGDVQVPCLMPFSDMLAQWTPKSGIDNYAMVLEKDADDDVSYNHCNGASGLKDLFGVDPSTPIDPAVEILGVQLSIRAKDAVDSCVLKSVISNGLAETLSVELGLASTYSTWANPTTRDPSGVQWAKATLLGANYGYRVR